MTWVIGFALLWVVVASAAALVIGRGLQIAEQRELVPGRTSGGDAAPEVSIVRPRRITG